MNALDVKLRNWYMENFPNDELGNDIDPDATFQDLLDALEFWWDVYEIIGVGDSVIRERLFAGLTEITGVSYEYIYKQWV